ncbi:ATP-binding protein [Corynebacterium cystitidis]|uniref:AAA+ ATPase domain-containing protein n=1 Tax=Corynebacterium cystitidis DSM 20524 TaxID=1121357 RepID=A0A1H9QQH1_9CORY|nr:ATP-binding protein [Corynebacterium cystitidis]WJY81697.1 hypothetical protein CCYS_03660 [Corynebacterium cystitidis DSM 20524]SER62688.1 hypothetical protein SAMN05661109_00633 [Corynebacterium cystitidis DSM 20524]SNV84767.1 AAA+ superfamily ATPase [Corynebacterium cystitidis]
MRIVKRELLRHSVSLAREILADSPLLVVQGARQVGKSTLLRQAFLPEEAVFTTMDDSSAATLAKADPRGFVEQSPEKTLVIDEAQRVPELALALKASIDADRRPGRFAVTGSADLLRSPGVSDSLAGRAESLHLGPLSQGEIQERTQPEDWVSWMLDGAPDLAGIKGNPDTVREAVIRGGYPEPLKRSTPARIDSWFDSYVNNLLVYDAGHIFAGSSLHLHLDKLLHLVAAQGHAELVKAKFARSLGLAESTLSQHLELLKTMYLTHELVGWGLGFSGRVTRRPKLSLHDTGLASSLTGLTVEKSRLVGGMEYFGALLEGFVAGELFKQRSWSQSRYRLYHFRERDTEIDIVVELRDGRLILVEVKSARDVNAKAWAHLSTVRKRLGRGRVAAAVVLYMGEHAAAVNLEGGPVHLLPVNSLWAHP